MADSITVETDIFEHREVKRHFINPCCFGEDFAAWLRDGLKANDARFKYSDVIQEDYGWGFWASDEDDRLWIAVSYVGEGPQEPPPQWVISVRRDPGLNLIKWLRFGTETVELLQERIRSILNANPAIRIVK